MQENEKISAFGQFSLMTLLSLFGMITLGLRMLFDLILFGAVFYCVGKAFTWVIMFGNFDPQSMWGIPYDMVGVRALALFALVYVALVAAGTAYRALIDLDLARKVSAEHANR